jgi:hypothetical protein
MRTAIALLLLAAAGWLVQAQEIDDREDYSLVRREMLGCNTDGTYTCGSYCPWIGTQHAYWCCR